MSYNFSSNVDETQWHLFYRMSHTKRLCLCFCTKWFVRLESELCTKLHSFLKANSFKILFAYILDVVEVEWSSFSGVFDWLSGKCLVLAIDETGIKKKLAH